MVQTSWELGATPPATDPNAPVDPNAAAPTPAVAPATSLGTPSWAGINATPDTVAQDRLQTAQDTVYGSPAPKNVVAARDQAGKLLAQVNSFPDAQSRQAMFNKVGGQKLYDALDDATKAKYGISKLQSMSGPGGIAGLMDRAGSKAGADVQGFLSFLGRPAQASLQILRQLEKGKPGGAVLNAGRALLGEYDAGGSNQNEAVQPTSLFKSDDGGFSLHGSDTYQPHGLGDAALNFGGQVLADPATYLTVGASGAAKVGLKSLAQGGLEPGALEAIGKLGVQGAVDSGAVTRDAIEQTLRDQATAAGSQNVDRAVTNQMRGLDATASGPARLRVPFTQDRLGVNIPGTSSLTKNTVGATPTLAERAASLAASDSPLAPVGGLLQVPAEAATRLGTGAGNMFNTRALTERGYGEMTADVLGAHMSQADSVASDAIKQTNASLLDATKGIPKSDYSNLATLHPEAAAKVDSAAADVQKISDQYGLGHDVQAAMAAHPTDPLEGLFKVSGSISRDASQAQLVKNMMDPVTGLVSGTGERLAKSVDDLAPLANPNALNAPSIVDRTAQAAEAAKAQGLVQIGKGSSIGFVPESVAKDVSNFNANITSDAGVRTFNELSDKAMRQFKTGATILPVSPSFFSRFTTSHSLLMVGAGFKHVSALADGFKVARALRMGTVDSLPEDLRALASKVVDTNLYETSEAARDLGSGSLSAKKAVEQGGATPSLLGKATMPYNAALDKGAGYMKQIQGTMRIAMMQDGLLEGMGVQDAAMRAQRTLMDYSDLTKTEEKFKKVDPFFAFMRKNLDLQGDLLLHKPGVLTTQVHAQQALGNAFGNPKNGELPDWAVGAGYVPMGGALVNFQTPLNSAGNAVSPLMGLANHLTDGRPLDAGDELRPILGHLGGPLIGAAKGAAEVVTGKSLFSGGNNKKGTLGTFLANMAPVAGRFTNATQGVGDLTSGDGRSILNFLGVGTRDIKSGDEKAVLGRVQQSLADIKSSGVPLPKLAALQAAGIAPPTPPTVRTLTGLTKEEAFKADQANRQDALRYKAAFAAWQAGQDRPPTFKQKELLAALQAGPRTLSTP